MQKNICLPLKGRQINSASGLDSDSDPWLLATEDNLLKFKVLLALLAGVGKQPRFRASNRYWAEKALEIWPPTFLMAPSILALLVSPNPFCPWKVAMGRPDM